MKTGTALFSTALVAAALVLILTGHSDAIIVALVIIFALFMYGTIG